MPGKRLGDPDSFLRSVQADCLPVFVYSQFRSLEGIGIFSLVLKANGYAPFRLQKNSDSVWYIHEEPDEVGKPKYAFYSGTEDEEYKRKDNSLILLYR